MKKLIALAALMVALPSQASVWELNKYEVPVLESLNDRGFFAMYQKHDGLDYIVLGRKHGECTDGGYVTMDVDRKSVGFTFLCQYGYSYLKPKSEAGRKYLMDRFLGQSTVKVGRSNFVSFGLQSFIDQNDDRIKNAL